MGIGRKVIFLGPGCGHVAYTMGFISSLLSDAELSAEIRTTGAVFGGVSSGAMSAAYAMAALNSMGTMEHWYYTEMRKGFELVQQRSTLAMGEGLEAAAHRYYDSCRKAAVHANSTEHNIGSMNIADEVPWLRHFPLSVTEAWPPLLRPRMLTDFRTSNEFVQSMLASSYVPGIMGLKPVIGLPDSTLAFDGFIGSLRIRWPDSYLYVSFLPTMPPALLGKHHLRAFDYDSTGGGLSGLLVKSFPWGDPDWADAAYHRGVRDADANLPELRAQIIEFLRD